MTTSLIRQYQYTKSKYLRFSSRLQRSYKTGEFYRLPGRKQNWLVSRVRKLWEKLKMLEKQLKLAIAAGAITLLLSFSDSTQAQPNFVLSPDKNPCPPPLIFGMSPLLNDVDMDGDLDILVTHEDNNIIWYKNIGSSSVPDFIEVPENENPFQFPDSLNVETWNINALVDIDGDGDVDIFTDEYYAGFLENTGTAANPEFEVAENPLGYSYFESLVDIDSDGDFDMLYLDEFSNYDPILMEYTSIAKIRIVQNIGTAQVPNMDIYNPVYFEISNQPEGANSFDQLMPMDFDNDGDIDFLNKVEFYNEAEYDYYALNKIIENTGTSQIPQFTFMNDENNPFINLGTGWEDISPADLDDDGDIDALLNENYVALAFYRNTGNILVKDQSVEAFAGFFFTPSYIKPSFIDFDGDGDLDVYTFSYDDELPGIYYENTGNINNAEFTATEDYFPFIESTGDVVYPLFVDIDSDGDLDCFVWDYEEYSGMLISFYKNTGTQQSPNYQLDNNNPMPLLEDMANVPAFADFDGDGDKDMIICIYDENEYSYSQYIKYYKNTGDPGESEFTLIEDNTNPFKNVNEVYGVYGSPLVIADLDMDGDFDVFFSDYYGNTGFRENIGTPTNPLFAMNDANNPIRTINMGYYGGFSLVDLDGDGDQDLFSTSTYNTLVDYYVNTDPRTSSIGNQQILHSEYLKVYPNPASDYCILNLEGPSSGICNLKIIDIHGQVLRTESFTKVNGHIQHSIDISSLIPGVYLVNVTQGNQRHIARLIVE